MPKDVVAEALCALFVVAQRLQRAPERRMGDAPEQSDAHADGDDGKDVKRPVAAEPRAGHALHAVLATGHVGPFVGDLEGDLRKCQGQQGEIQATAAQDDQRDHGGQDQRESRRRTAAQQSRSVRRAAYERGGIAGAAEENRGAEWHQAGVADQHADAGAIQRVDGNLRNQADRCTDQMPQAGQREQNDEDEQDRVAQQIVHSKRSHRSPSRPRGRSSSIRAMKMYITAPEAAG